MTTSDIYQENKQKFTDILVNSKDLLVLEFDKQGKVLFANAALEEILGWKLKNINLLKTSGIFDFRISEVERILEEKDNYSCEINMINSNKEFIPSKTNFIKSRENITAISMPLLEILQEKKDTTTLIKTLDTVKNLLSKQPEPEKEIFSLLFNQIKSLINYDQAIIFLLEGDSLVVKARDNISLANKDYLKVITEKDRYLAKIIKKKANILETRKLVLPKELGITFAKEPSSIVAVPLSIREMVYGIIVLINNEEKFTNNDAKVLEAVSSAASYIVKDNELSEVFKMQLKILRENIKERSKTLELIKEQNKKILEADRIKNEFLANMSHELRTPLNAIIGFSEALQLKIFGELNDKQNEYIGDIHANGEHLLRMINDLLDLSKIESGKMELNTEVFDVKKSIEEAFNGIKPLADKKEIKLTKTLGRKNVLITADKRRFLQILYNLLSNAIKFTEEKGKVQLTLKESDENIIIAVKDTGIGIPLKYQDKIFEKFQQAKNQFSGKVGNTGLGLTITKELIELHNGHIKVESEENKGSCFTITLPLTPEIN